MAKAKESVIKYKIYGFKWSIYLTLLFIYRQIFYRLLQQSYSQYGEDLVVDKIIGKKKIIYVDVGANHPVKFNNTYHFYLKGGQGINVDPNQKLIANYKTVRPRDISLKLGISNAPKSLTFYNLFPDVNSTFSYDYYQECLAKGSTLIDQSKVKIITLNRLFDQYLTSKKIDFLSVDTESFDLEVLKSNNWKKYRPTVICVETISQNGVHEYLESLNYRQVHHNQINSIYVTR